MTEQEIRCIVDGQRSFFLTGNTLDVEFRIQSLQKLKAFILNRSFLFSKWVSFT